MRNFLFRLSSIGLVYLPMVGVPVMASQPKKTPLIPEQIPYHPYIPSYKLARSSYPYITGYTFRSMCDFILDCEKNNLEPHRVETGDIIFVSRDFIEEFFTKYRPAIKHSFILLTHHYEGNCDPSVPGPYAHYLEDEKLIAWFTLNADIIHPKLKPLPLGIANSFYPIGDTRVYDYHIKNFRRLQKTELLYSNFTPNTDERLRVYNSFKNKDFCTTAERKSQSEYLIDMAQHKFVLSPRGGGIDCYRTWEALFMGSIPIVKSSAIDVIFKDLPVVIVQEWNEVTEKFLEQTYESMSRKVATYSYEKMYIPYWINELLKCKFNAKFSLEGEN